MKPTAAQRKLLEKHAEHFHAMALYVRECDPTELEELEDACKSVGVTCAWDIYKAAKFLQEEIDLCRNLALKK